MLIEILLLRSNKLLCSFPSQPVAAQIRHAHSKDNVSARKVSMRCHVVQYTWFRTWAITWSTLTTLRWHTDSYRITAHHAISLHQIVSKLTVLQHGMLEPSAGCAHHQPSARRLNSQKHRRLQCVYIYIYIQIHIYIYIRICMCIYIYIYIYTRIYA